MPRRWKVLLCGYYGMGNCGDEFLASAAIGLLKRNGLSSDEIVMLSGNVPESEALHGVRAFDRWSLKEIIRAARQSETFLLGGGGIFQDSSSLISPWYYWCVMEVASLCGCRLWAVGQSIGPLRSRVSRALAGNAFSKCGAVMVRDRHSSDFLGGACSLADDLVLTLAAEPSAAERRDVLVNFRPCGGGLVEEAAQRFSRLPFPQGARAVGVAMSVEDAGLMERLCANGRLKLDELVLCTAANWNAVFSRGAYAWGMRLHFGVLCLKRRVPCALVPYDPKVGDFAARWGASPWDEDGALPRPWLNESELELAVERTTSEFGECFKRVMSR